MKINKKVKTLQFPNLDGLYLHILLFYFRFSYQPPFIQSVLKAAEEEGFGVTEDMVGDKITGFTIAQTISKDGVRVSSAASYLWPYRSRKNLDIALNATATKINFIKNKAYSVDYIIVSVTYSHYCYIFSTTNFH